MAKNELIAHVSVCILENQDNAVRKQLLEDSKGIKLTSTPPLAVFGCKMDHIFTNVSLFEIEALLTNTKFKEAT